MSQVNAIKVIADRYKLLRKIGDGGMGDIYLAEDLKLSRNVAIKTIRREFKEVTEVRKRIDRECNLHATLGVHPNIVALHDKLEEEGNIFLIMEYVEGKTLSALLKNHFEAGTKFKLNEILTILGQVLDALSHIHTHDILHRDIKPSNILLKEKVGGGLIAKLMDFGIAAIDNNEAAHTKLTTLTTGGPGTPAYMAPERIDSDTFGESGPPTDLYSVGIIFYEMLGNNPPFKGTMTEVFTGHLAREPDITALSSIYPDNVIDILKKSLQKKQKERFQQASDFSKALQLFINGETTSTLAIPEEPEIKMDQTVLATGQHDQTIAAANEAKQNSSRKNNTLLIYGLAILLAIGVTGGGWFYLTKSRPSENAVEDTLITETQTAAPEPKPEQPEQVIEDITPTQVQDQKLDEAPAIKENVVKNPIESIPEQPVVHKEQEQKQILPILPPGYEVPTTPDGRGGDAEAILKQIRVTSPPPKKTPQKASTAPTPTPPKQNRRWDKIEDTTTRM